MKKIHGILLSSALILSSAGLIALLSPKGSNQVSAGVDEVNVAGQDVKSAGTISGDKGTCKYEFVDNKAVLTFTNFEYEGPCNSSNEAAIWYKGSNELVINVVGTNVIKDTRTNNNNSRGILLSDSYKNKKLTFTGSGSLAVTASPAVYSSYGLQNLYTTATFNGPIVTLTAGNVSTGLQQTFTQSVGLWTAYLGPAVVNRGGVICNAGSAPKGSFGATSTNPAGSTNNITVKGGYFEANGGTSNNNQSYGMYNDGSILILDSKANAGLFTGNNGAVSGNFTHDIPGEGWNNKAGTGSSTSIPAEWGSIGNYKRAEFTNVIEETVTNYDGGRDGNPHSISVTVDKPGEYEIKYGTTEGTYDLDTPPTLTEFGELTVYYKITAPYIGEKTGSGTVKISKVDPTYTAPTVIEGLAYDGTSKTLLNAGTISGGTMKYRLGTTGEYSETIPSAVEPGTYPVYYALIGDDYHNTVMDLGPVNAVLAKGANEYVGDEPTGVSGLVYDGNSHELIDSSKTYSGTHGHVEYRLGTSGEFSTEIPSATDGGTYTVYYKIVSDDPTHYNDSAVKSVSVTIAKASNDYVSKPTPVTETLVYTGEPIVLANGGEAEHGTILYKVDNGSYSANLPTAIDAGTHTVYFKLDGGTNYESVAEESFTITINKAESSYKEEPAALTDLYYNGEAQNLVSPGSTQDGQIQYSLTEEGPFSNKVPQGTNVGEYTVYYKIVGDKNHEDSDIKSVKVLIKEVDKSLLAETIKEAEELYEELKDEYPIIAIVLKKEINEAKKVYNDEVASNEEVAKADRDLQLAMEKAIASTRDSITDKESGVSIVSADGTAIPANIDLRVEVRSDIKAEQGSEERSKINQMLSSGQRISHVYEIKLIRTVDGVETEIQPSDIKAGLKLIIHVSTPNGLKVDGMKILHIHNDGKMEFVENYKVENGEIVFTVSSLSELAFIEQGLAIPVWALILIILGGLLLIVCLIYLLMFFVFNKWIKKDEKAVRVVKCGKKDDKVKLLTMSLKKEFRSENEVFKSKAEALKK